MNTFLPRFLFLTTPFVSLIFTVQAELSLDEYFPTLLQETYTNQDIGINNPASLAKLPDGRLLAIEKSGESFVFDVNRWIKTPIKFPSSSSPQATLVDAQGVLWIAGDGFLGYMKNQFDFIDISKSFSHENTPIKDFFFIHETKDWIHFSNFKYIFHFNTSTGETKITKFKDSFASRNWTWNGNLYASTNEKILVWNGNSFSTHIQWNHESVAHIGWKSNGYDYYLNYQGIVVYRNDDHIKTIKIDRYPGQGGYAIATDQYVCLTRESGVTILNLDGSILGEFSPWFYEKITSENSYLPQSFEGSDLWITTDYGFIRINFSDSIRQIGLKNGHHISGAWDIETFENDIYTASTNGLRVWTRNTFINKNVDSRDLNLSYSMWKHSGKLLVGTWNVLASLNNSKKMEDWRIDSSYRVFSKASSKDLLWVTKDTGIVSLDRKLNEQKSLTGMNDEVTSMTEFNQVLWVTGHSGRLYNADLKKTNNIRDVTNAIPALKSRSDLSALQVFKINNQLCILSSGGLYKLENNDLEEFDFPLENGWSWEIPQFSNEQNSIILAQRNSLNDGLRIGELLVSSAGELEWKPKLVSIGAKQGSIRRIKKLDEFSGDVVAVISPSLIEFINLNESPETLPPPDAPKLVRPLHELTRDQPGILDSIYRYDPLQPMTVQLHYSELSLEKPIKFAGRLKGSKRDLEFNQNGTFIYPGIMRGTYVFEGFTVDPFGNESEIVRHEIRVIPPWYISNAAIGGYVITLGLVIFFSVQVRTRQLRKRSKELEETVEERTKDLMLANQAKSIFVSNVSHEIRNPLNGLLGLAQNLNEGDVIDKGTLQRLRRPSLYLYRFLSNVLDFSKFETGGIRLNKRVFDPNELLDSVESMFAGDFQERNLTFVADYRYENDPFLCASQEAIEMILVNLVGNAVKFTPPGRNIRTAMRYSDGWLTLTVADTGIGISDDVKERIFEPYEQGDQGPLVTGEKGAGIGLSLVKQTAEQLGGYVEVTSEIGKGSTFTTSIPVSPSHQSDIPGVVDEVKLEGKFLLVEDLEYNLKLLTDTLTRWGAEVDGVSTGQDALSKIQSANYDMAILDYDLPDMNGSQVAGKIRKSQLNAQTPIVGLSAYTDQEFIQKALDGGMNDFQFKPVNVQKLVECIHKFVPEKIQFTLKKKMVSENGRTSLRTIKRSGPGGSESLETSAQAYLDQLDKLVESLNKSDLGSKKFETILHQLKGHSNLIHHRTSSQYWQRISEASKAGERMSALEEMDSMNEVVTAMKYQISSLLLLENDFETLGQFTH